jgi:hypothetical protein
MTISWRCLWVVGMTIAAYACSSPLKCLPDGGAVPCFCANGKTGTQSCNQSGSAFEACQCGDTTTPPDASVEGGVDGGPLTCTSPRMNCGGTCVDVTSNMAHCGQCGRACTGASTCSQGQCTTSPQSDCKPCATSADCPSVDMVCGRRRCDGARGCYNPAMASCSTVGGISCPAVQTYDRCANSTDCWPYADCRPVISGAPNVCQYRCTSTSDCPSWNDYTAGEVCSTSDSHCFLACSPDDPRSTCPFGQTCTPFDADTSVGYCR